MASEAIQWLKEHVEKPKFQEQLLETIPASMSVKKQIGYFILAALKNPKLADCEPVSIHEAILKVSAAELYFDGVHAYPVPRYDKRVGGDLCHYDLGYRGMMHILWRSGFMANVWMNPVHEEDTFFVDGHEYTHRFDPSDPDRGKRKGIVAGVKTHAGEILWEYMNEAELAKVAAVSRSKYGPRAGAFAGEMDKKGPFKRLFKRLPQLEERFFTVVEGDNEGVDLSAADSLLPAPQPRLLLEMAETDEGVIDAPLVQEGVNVSS